MGGRGGGQQESPWDPGRRLQGGGGARGGLETRGTQPGRREPALGRALPGRWVPEGREVEAQGPLLLLLLRGQHLAAPSPPIPRVSPTQQRWLQSAAHAGGDAPRQQFRTPLLSQMPQGRRRRLKEGLNQGTSQELRKI